MYSKTCLPGMLRSCSARRAKTSSAVTQLIRRAFAGCPLRIRRGAVTVFLAFYHPHALMSSLALSDNDSLLHNVVNEPQG